MPCALLSTASGPSFPHHHHRWRTVLRDGVPLLALSALIAPLSAHAEAGDEATPSSYGRLPDPPTLRAQEGDGMLFLELILNGRPTRQIIPVYFENNTIRLRPQDLLNQGVELHVNGDHLYLSDIPEARYDYEMAEQKLHVTLPPHLLPHHTIGRSRQRLEVTPADTAFLLNYDIFVTSGLKKADPQISIFSEQRLTGDFGMFSTSGLWRNGPHHGYQRYSSSFRTSNAKHATILEVGDFITRSLSEASAVRLGGIQISRDFTVRPDIITYPMPRFSGRAALPSTVELLIDGRSVANAEVDPGQFIFDTLPITSGAGQAQLVVTDMHGRSTSASMPFYITSNLLASGLTDFAISAGFFREHYGIKNFAYSDFAATASLRYGLNDFVTAEARAEYSDHFWLLGGGARSRIGNLGIVSTSFAHSSLHGRGGEYWSVGYDYQAGGFSIALRHNRQSHFYRDLGTLDYIESISAKQQSIAGVNLILERWGNWGLNYADYRYGNQSSARYANINWSRSLLSRGQIYAQAGRDLKTKGWNASLSLSLFFGGNAGSISASVADQSGGHRSYRIDHNRAVPTDTGIGWNVGATFAEDGTKAWRSDFQWRTQPTQFRFGGTGVQQGQGGSQHNIWAGASGGLVLMDGFIAPANQLPSSFAVVSTSGFAGIPVRYEHQLIGRTNKDGRLFIPTLTPWYPGRIAIDPLELPADVSVPEVERHLAVEGGRGVHVRFNLEKMQPILAAVRDADGQYIASGSAVLVKGETLTYIGWDGLLYLEDVRQAPDKFITIVTSDQKACRVSLPTEKLTSENWNLGDLPCLPVI